MHGLSLPSIDGDYLLSEMNLTGTATLQLVDCRPKKWRRNGRIDMRTPLLLSTRGGRVFAFDESKSKSIEVAVAAQAFIEGLQPVVQKVIPEGHLVWHDSPN